MQFLEAAIFFSVELCQCCIRLHTLSLKVLLLLQEFRWRLVLEVYLSLRQHLDQASGMCSFDNRKGFLGVIEIEIGTKQTQVLVLMFREKERASLGGSDLAALALDDVDSTLI